MHSFLFRKKKILAAVLLTAVFIAGFSADSYIFLNKNDIIPVPYLSQKGVLDRGCELISAIMVLHFYRCPVGVEDFAAQVPTSELTQTENGLAGELPSNVFIGDPHAMDGLGCYSPVITTAMNQFLPRVGKHAQALEGVDFSLLVSQYLKCGTPIILWVTSNMAEPSAGPKWVISKTGETFQWISGEHCMVMIGCDRQYCYFRDPDGPDGTVIFDRALVEQRYRLLGSQAIVVQ